MRGTGGSDHREGEASHRCGSSPTRNLQKIRKIIFYWSALKLGHPIWYFRKSQKNQASVNARLKNPTGKVVGGFFRAVIWTSCFLGLLDGHLQEGFTGGDGTGGGKARRCGVRRRPLEKRCWKWSELGKVEAFVV